MMLIPPPFVEIIIGLGLAWRKKEGKATDDVALVKNGQPDHFIKNFTLGIYPFWNFQGYNFDK